MHIDVSALINSTLLGIEKKDRNTLQVYKRYCKRESLHTSTNTSLWVSVVIGITTPLLLITHFIYVSVCGLLEEFINI